MAQGADPNYTDMSNSLYDAFSRPNYRLARLLLDYKTDPEDLDSGGQNILILATQIGDAEAVELLLEYGANPLQMTKDGRTALSIAIDNQQHACRTRLENHINHGKPPADH